MVSVFSLVKLGTAEGAQWVKVLAAKTDNVGSVLANHMVEEEFILLQPVL